MKTIEQIFQEIDSRAKTMEFFCTGFKRLDEALDGGFMRKELVVLGADSGIGKSYFAGELVWSMAQQGFKTAYFSLEISSEMVISRLLASLSGIKPAKIVRSNLTLEEKAVVEDRKLDIQVWEDNLHIYDDVYEIEKIEALLRGNKYDFVAIDFIQNVVAKGEEYERMSSVALRLQKLAKELNCCILTLSQLSNSAVKSDHLEYKGSGGIAMVCDLGFILKRNKGNSIQNNIKLELRKNRRGQSGIEFDFVYKLPGGKIYEA